MLCPIAVAYSHGGGGGQSATPDSEKIVKNRGENQEKSGKKEDKSGRKGKDRNGYFA